MFCNADTFSNYEAARKNKNINGVTDVDGRTCVGSVQLVAWVWATVN